MKVVVLLSGGIDSTTCLAMAVDKHGAENVHALNIMYGQKHKRELESAKAVADYYGVDYKVMDISSVMKFSDCPLLENSTKEIKHMSYAEQLKELPNNTVDTYVPFRNGVMLSVAAAYAVCVGAEIIFYGAHADDAAGSAYPDCSPEFATAIDEAIFRGTGNNVRLLAPLINKNKAEVIKTGLDLQAPYNLTWSCYEGGEKPCGECGTCIDRKKGFEQNGVSDPCDYMEVIK